MTETTAVTRAPKLIEGCTDPKSLRQIAANARQKGELIIGVSDAH